MRPTPIQLWTVLAAVTVTLAACTARPSTPRPSLRSDGEILTVEELTALTGTTQNAYSAVERLRPLFLSVRPGAGIVHGAPPRLYVFIDGSLAGDVDVLKTIPLSSVESIRRMRATAAFTQLGEIQSGDGVILVRLRR
jgi:hypothetical protein